jgi:DNA-nicking Smr family endonuclease
MDARLASLHKPRMPALVRPSRLSEEDRALWAAFAGKVRALPGHGLAPSPPGPAPAAPTPPPPPTPVSPARLATLSVGDSPGGLDRGSWNRLSRGRARPERRLDLHGRTAQAAFHAVQEFLTESQLQGVRCVEVITGRGTGEHGGVLRRELPVWLNLPALRPLVLAAAYARAGNPGAVRLLLRRR